MAKIEITGDMTVAELAKVLVENFAPELLTAAGAAQIKPQLPEIKVNHSTTGKQLYSIIQGRFPDKVFVAAYYIGAKRWSESDFSLEQVITFSQGSIDITPDMTVDDVEMQFRGLFGLGINILNESSRSEIRGSRKLSEIGVTQGVRIVLVDEK